MSASADPYSDPLWRQAAKARALSAYAGSILTYASFGAARAGQLLLREKVAAVVIINL